MTSSISRRDLYAFGEPFGESATRIEAGRRIYGGGGGFGTLASNVVRPAANTIPGAFAAPTPAPKPVNQMGENGDLGTQTPPTALTSPAVTMTAAGAAPFSQSVPTQSTVPSVSPQSQTDTQAGVAEYAQPYVNTMLGSTMQQLFNYDASGNATGLKGYNPYSYNAADYFAGFTPLQQQAQQGVASLQNPWQSEVASGTIADLISRAGTMNYQPQTVGYQSVSAPKLQDFQMAPAQQVGTQDYTGSNVDKYMSPYMQNVVQQQQREAQRTSDIQAQADKAQAARAGAMGGSRSAILEAQRMRDLATQKGNIQAQGLQNAFQNAQQQFNTQQQANLQAQQANQQAGLTTGQQNLAARLGVQQLGSGQNLQAQQLNQAAQQQANQLAAQQQQFGANYGLQGLQAAMSGANQLSGLGTAGLQNQLNILNAQQQTGATQQQLQQNILNQAAQNYNTAQQYPYMQLGFMQNMLQGLPITTSSQQQYQAAPSTVSQLAGLGMAGLGLGSLLGSSGGTGGTTGSSGGSTGLGGLSNIIGGLNNLGGTLSDAFGGLKGALGFAEGGEISDPIKRIEEKIDSGDVTGLTALALSKLK